MLLTSIHPDALNEHELIRLYVPENEDQTKDAVVGNCFGSFSRTILFAEQTFRSQT